MRLRQLFEDKTTEVAIIFGRFNPPHKGHRVAWETAATKDIWYVGTNEETVGLKDPLPYEVKVECMKVIWPDVADHIISETSWLSLASRVYKEHGKATLFCVTDEEWVVPTVQEYNGKEGAHGFYDFPEIRLYHDSIEEAKLELRKSSATSLRDAVSKGDRQAFSDAAGVSAETPVMGKPFFDLVAEYLIPYQEKAAEKERAKEEKAKAKAEKEKAKAEKSKKKDEPEEDQDAVKNKDFVAEGMFGLSDKEKGAIQHVTMKVSDIYGNWDHEAGNWSKQGIEELKTVLKDNPKYIKYALNLSADDYDA